MKKKDKAKDNVRDFKVYQGKKKTETKPQFMPRFIREVRTPNSERYSIVIEDGEGENNLAALGTLDLHIGETIHATLVIVPEVDEMIVKYLELLIQTELVDSLGLEIETCNVFMGVSNCLTYDAYDDDDDDDQSDD